MSWPKKKTANQKKNRKHCCLPHHHLGIGMIDVKNSTSNNVYLETYARWNCHESATCLEVSRDRCCSCSCWTVSIFCPPLSMHTHHDHLYQFCWLITLPTEHFVQFFVSQNAHCNKSIRMLLLLEAVLLVQKRSKSVVGILMAKQKSKKSVFSRNLGLITHSFSSNALSLTVQKRKLAENRKSCPVAHRNS